MAVTTSIPKIFTDKEAGEILGRSTDALAKDRANGTGPQWLKIEGSVRYLESDLIAYLNACRQGPAPDGSKAASPAAITAAMMTGSAERRAANAAKLKAMQDLDAADRNGDGTVDPYAVTVSNVGQTPGAKMERHWNVPAQSFDNRPVTVAVAPAQNGQVPVPWQK